MDLSIVFTNYDTAAHLQTCLESIRRFPPECDFEIIVVNNGSKRDTVEDLRSLGTDVEVIDLKSNVGFGQACNIGMKASRGSYILLLNTDTYFVDSSLQRCWEFATGNPDVDIFNCRVEFPDGRRQQDSSPLYQNNPALEAVDLVLQQNALVEKFGKGVLPVFRCLRETGRWLTGCFIFLKRTVYEKTGGFDPDFYLYFEEVDWFRNRIYPQGFRSAFFPNATVVHLEGASQHHSNIGEQFQLSSFLYHYKCGNAALWAAVLCHIFNYVVRLLCMPFVPRYWKQNLSRQRRLLHLLAAIPFRVLAYPSKFAARPFPLISPCYRGNYSWSRLSESVLGETECP